MNAIRHSDIVTRRSHESTWYPPPSTMQILKTIGCVAFCSVAAIGCREAKPPAAEPDPPAVATVSSAEVATATEAAVADQSPAMTHDVTGAYFPTDPWPAGFAELDFLSLATIDENAAPAPLNGFLRPKQASAEDYTLLSPKLEGKRLTFTTKVVGGTQYAFTGTFEVLADFPANPPSYETVVLSGTLTRQRDGKTVAETPVKFRYEAGG
jgi:hypothetical protein